MLARAIRCFQGQSYDNRELVVLYEADDTDSSEILDRVNDPDVRRIEVPRSAGQYLGSLRNLAIAESDGEYVCQWDDDDWYDTHRLTRQWEALVKHHRPACVLSRWICLDLLRQQAFVARRRAWEGSILCRKTDLGSYPNLALNEDHRVVGKLLVQDRLALLDAPWLYVYINHGSNAWDREHWRHVLSGAQPLSSHDTQQLLVRVALAPVERVRSQSV